MNLCETCRYWDRAEDSNAGDCVNERVAAHVHDPIVSLKEFGCRFHQPHEKQHAGQAYLTPE